MITLQALFNQNILLTEMVVENPELQKKVDEFANLSNQIDKLEAELKGLNSRFKGIADELTPLLSEAKDNCLKTQNHLVFIKTKGFERNSFAYKEAFEWLLSRVNPLMKKIVEEALEATKKISKIAPKIAVQKNEGIGDIWVVKMIKAIINRIVPHIRFSNQMIKQANQQFEKAISRMRT